MTLLKIVKSGETKNFISFDELTSGTNVYLTKSRFNKVLELFKYWRSNQTSTNFTAQLFSLILIMCCILNLDPTLTKL